MVIFAVTNTSPFMPNAKEISNMFLSLADPEVGDNVSNLKLQKLLYYAQGFHLAMHGEALFDEDIVAWEHGPVVIDIYHLYKEYGAGAIPMPEGFNDECLTAQQKELIKEVWDVYGQFSAWKLRNMTHSERPWIETDKNDVISHEIMKDYFKDFITD